MTPRDRSRHSLPLVHDAVGYHVSTRPSASALTDAAGTMTYGELGERMRLLAAGLRRRELRRVGVLLGNTSTHLELLLAAAATGVTVTPMHPAWGHQKLGEVATAAGVDAVIVAGDRDARLADQFIDCESLVDEAPDRYDLPDVDPEAWQLLAPTGGTSAVFKAVAISHKASAARVFAQMIAFGIGPDSRFLATTPLYHGAARGSSLAHLMAGGRVELHDGFDVVRFAQAAQDASSTFCVPTMLVKLLDAGVGPLPRSLQIIVSGASLDPDIAAQAEKQLGCRLVNYYASVDAGGIAAAPLGQQDTNAGGATAGFPFPGSRIDLIAEDGRAVTAGEIGRVTVASASLASAEVLGDGSVRKVGDRLETGDLAYFDDVGRLVVTGRADDVIISGGVNVPPEEVELQLRRHPAVRDVLVVGVEDPTWGETIGCLLVLDGAAVDEVQEWAAGRLASAERPRRVGVVSSIPLTPLGKPDRRAAAALLKEAS